MITPKQPKPAQTYPHRHFRPPSQCRLSSFVVVEAVPSLVPIAAGDGSTEHIVNICKVNQICRFYTTLPVTWPQRASCRSLARQCMVAAPGKQSGNRDVLVQFFPMDAIGA